jgi:hypothetical protein
VENWISLESSSDFEDAKTSQALLAVSSIRLVLSGSSKEGLMEESQESDDDDEYSLKVGMLCFSSSGRYLGMNPPDIHQARQWAKVQASHVIRFDCISIHCMLKVTGWTGS